MRSFINVIEIIVFSHQEIQQKISKTKTISSNYAQFSNALCVAPLKQEKVRKIFFLYTTVVLFTLA